MDQWNQTKSQLLAQMDICMGGRVAEEIIFGTEQVTTGAGSDFDQATRIARLMVTKFGMSDKVCDGSMVYFIIISFWTLLSHQAATETIL